MSERATSGETSINAKPAKVFVALGSNLQQPLRQLMMACMQLERQSLAGSFILSSIYFSAPMGPKNQNGYYNAACQLETHLDPMAYLRALQMIERQQGRERKRRWGPRTLDLDLLLYNDLCLQLPDLTLPHPGLTDRWFVLKPLNELAPSLKIPGIEMSISTLLNQYPGARSARTVPFPQSGSNHEL